MGARLQDIVLEIMLMQQDQPLLIGEAGKLLQTTPIPGIVLGQIIFAQTIPGETMPAAGKGLLVKGRSHISVHASYALVVVPSPIVPKAIVMFECGSVISQHSIGKFIEVVC